MNSDREKLQFCLKAVLMHGAEPMPEDVLVDALTMRFRFPRADAQTVIAQAQSYNLLIGGDDKVLGTCWGLTQLGAQKARQLL